ncbi:DUF1761 domain-containing protein [Novosphingobium profundi]|uniref:DUF1761 domain-containing protein n=1 Tax=Novosphingobium profundi TaxID=1774954 RepID=UPI001CFE162A|nr:DUF1761 domain-containing protein [Novosphingobium profundi]
MIDAFSQINFLAVLTATVANFLLGGIWFAALFAKPYARALGIEDRPPLRPAPIFLIGPLLCGAVTIVTTAFLLQALRIDDYGNALGLGAIIGVGYLGAMTVNIAINPLFPRPFYYAMINVPLFVIGSLVSCVILVAMS